jgi:hypothetical protein
MSGFKKRKIKRWIIVTASIVIPSSGYVLTGRPERGLFMLMWMFLLGYLTCHLNIYSSDTPLFIKCFGAWAVWLASVVEINHCAQKRG